MLRTLTALAAFTLMIGVATPVGAQMKDPPKKERIAALKLVDVNSASQTEIAGVGLDQATAKKIVDGRPFRNKRELVSRQVLTSEQYEKIKDLIVARRPMKK